MSTYWNSHYGHYTSVDLPAGTVSWTERRPSSRACITIDAVENGYVLSGTSGKLTGLRQVYTSFYDLARALTDLLETTIEHTEDFVPDHYSSTDLIKMSHIPTLPPKEDEKPF